MRYDNIEFKGDTVGTATSASYAQISDYSTAQSAIFRTDVNTLRTKPLLWETTYNSIPSSVVEVSNITGTINVKQGHILKISFGLGYNNSSGYRAASLKVFDGANWNYYENNQFQARISSGGGNNWDGGTSITRVLTAPNANQAYRVYADGAPVNTGAWLDLTRLY